MSKSNFDFEKILSPTNPKSSFSEYGEKRPLIISRSETDYYSDLVSMKDIDSILCTKGSHLSEVSLDKENSPYMGNYVSSNGVPKLKELYKSDCQGCSFLLTRVQERWKPISILRRNLEFFLNYSVRISLYMSPKDRQDFDTHNVVILQVKGSKNWRSYDSPITLPLVCDQKYLARLRHQLKSPVAEFCLNSGDLLYIPSGYIHELYTSESFSLHLTVGIHALKWSDLINNAVAMLTQKDVRFRESLPVGICSRAKTRYP
jgi:ribosomal protein L16 Arg81 hydroxylase